MKRQMPQISILETVHGPLMPSREIQKALGYKTPQGLRTARCRGHITFEMFPIKGRRGLFAKTSDVARFLESAMTVKKTIAGGNM